MFAEASEEGCGNCNTDDGCEGKSDDCEASGMAPTLSNLTISSVAEEDVSRLQRSKVHALDLHLRGATRHQIALEKGIKDSTVCGYLGDAIEKGCTYCWERLGLEEECLDDVRVALSSLTEESLERPRLQDVKAKMQSGRLYGEIKLALEHLIRTEPRFESLQRLSL